MYLKRFWHSAWARGLLVVASVLILCFAAVKISDEPQVTSPIWLLGFGALLASAVALFGDAVRSWVWRPVLTVVYNHAALTVVYDHAAGCCDKAIMRDSVNGSDVSASCYYFSLLISNKGTRRADKLEVLATELRKERQGGSYDPIRRYSMNLKWAYLGVSILDGMSPGMERFCNIGHIICPSERKQFPNEHSPAHDPDRTILSLDLDSKPNHLSHLMEPGKYELTILIAAANHKPIPKKLDIEITGEWAGELNEMLRDGIHIRLR